MKLYGVIKHMVTTIIQSYVNFNNNALWVIILESRSERPRGLRHELSFAHSNTGIMGSNPTWGIDVCVSLFCVCVYIAALRRTDPTSKECYRLCKRSRNWKSGQGPTKGSRTIDKYIIKHLVVDLRRLPFWLTGPKSIWSYVGHIFINSIFYTFSSFSHHLYNLFLKTFTF
jgi:hypothetical protein